MTKPGKKKEKKTDKKIDIRFSLNLSTNVKIIILSVLIILSIAVPLYYIYFANSINKFNSFPLDDPWIHLQFAKNLAEYGSFSYFKNEVITAGSTSPLYTFILAAGFLITKNEMWLSYILGILFFVLALCYFYKASFDTFPKENWLAIAATFLFVFDKWVNFISVSGMETTMYVFILVACFYYYHKRNAVLFAVTLGLSFWVRPDAAAFISAIIIDYCILMYVKKKSPKLNEEIRLFTKNDLLKIAAVSGGMLALYFVMNLIISGSVLPNTYSAKITYYSSDLSSRRPNFLKVEVWEYFTESAYILLFIPLIFAVIKILSDSLKMKYNRNILALVFIFLLIFIYWYKLPYAHRFGRYLIPVFPFYILLSVYGAREFFIWLGKFLNDKKIVNTLNIMFLSAAIIYTGSACYKNKETYQDQTRHIYIRQVETAKWLKNNTPEGSIIATHDVGAIAFYSGRKVIDVVGLINPEFIPKLHTPEFEVFMTQELKKQNVSYLAFLKEWYQVVNQPVLFRTGDKNFEIMEVYQYFPDKTHILSVFVNSGITYAGELIAYKDFQKARMILNQIAAKDTNSSLTYYLLAYTNSALGDNSTAEKNLVKAIDIYPDYREAVFALANIYKTQNKLMDARNTFETYYQNHPSDTAVAHIINSLSDTIKIK